MASFRILLKIREDIRCSRGTAGVLKTEGKRKKSFVAIICHHRYQQPRWQICRRCQQHLQSQKLPVSLLWLIFPAVSFYCWHFCSFCDPAVVGILSLPDVPPNFGVFLLLLKSLIWLTSLLCLALMLLLALCCCWSPAVVDVCSDSGVSTLLASFSVVAGVLLL